MRYITIFLLLIMPSQLLAKGDVPDPVAVERLAPDTVTRPVELSKIVVDLNRGQPFGVVKGGLICIGSQPLVWRSGRSQIDPEDFNEVFKDELEKVGFEAIGQSSNLFDDGRDNKAEFLVGGRIKSIFVDACMPESGFGNYYKLKGYAILEVEWQIYDRLDRKVVATHTTQTGFRQKKSTTIGLAGLIDAAFAENVRALIASNRLHEFLVGAPTDLNVARKPAGDIVKVAMRLPEPASATIASAVSSTVLVLSGDGHGSGFLISPDGYLLTNAHVVGQAKYVKVRWSDGSESLGEVIRSDNGRDVALIKSDSIIGKPISIRASKATVGENVRAIGAPLDEDLQNTVTSGIVSASRVLDGHKYVQSDVSVVPGNSGGPLIDSNGAVIAMTVAGISINGAPQGLNFFIPIEDAMAFLGIEPSEVGESGM